MVRAFLALDIPRSTREALVSRVDFFSAMKTPGIKWIAPENWHITLRFYGEVQDEAVAALKEEARAAAAGAKTFRASLVSHGAFPDWKHAQVLWIGVGEGSDAMRRIAKAAGHDDPHGFHPHLTLARVKSPQAPKALIDIFRTQEFPVIPAFEVSAAVLYRSHLGTEGSVYEKMAEFPFRNYNIR